jgi:hypothetical protein
VRLPPGVPCLTAQTLDTGLNPCIWGPDGFFSDASEDPVAVYALEARCNPPM